MSLDIRDARRLQGASNSVASEANLQAGDSLSFRSLQLTSVLDILGHIRVPSEYKWDQVLICFASQHHN
jgi:hypothetical protein